LKTRALFFPFDLFGSAGTRHGAELLADAFQEMLADNRRERLPTRARAYTNKVRFEEFAIETLSAYSTWHQDARQAVGDVWQQGDFLLWITGNHLGLLPVYEELGSKAGSLVVQFDAHLDIYNLSDCKAELSHGNFLLHAAGPLPDVVNVGHRELLLKPEYIGRYFQAHHPAADLAIDPTTALVKVRQACQAAERVFVDIDCDVFDSAYFPGSAHPQPFGISPHLLLRFLDAIWSDKVVGLSLAEFDPGRDVREQSLAILIWLLEYVLLKRHEKVR
jgi:agmatinase